MGVIRRYTVVLEIGRVYAEIRRYAVFFEMGAYWRIKAVDSRGVTMCVLKKSYERGRNCYNGAEVFFLLKGSPFIHDAVVKCSFPLKRARECNIFVKLYRKTVDGDVHLTKGDVSMVKYMNEYYIELDNLAFEQKMF